MSKNERAAAPSHPPVLPVGKMFKPYDGRWSFSTDGFYTGVPLDDATDDRRLEIAALQRCVWRDALDLPADELQALLRSAGIVFAQWGEYELCQRNFAAWCDWGKDGEK